MTPLTTLLDGFRNSSVTEREKGTYFEELIVAYLRNEAVYRDLYSDVWTYADWASQQGLDKRDTGIDLVAKTSGTGEYHAIQCKFYAEDYRMQKSDIDSFFTASGKKPFSHRVIVCTTNNWSEHAEDALRDQQPQVSKIDLRDLENSQIDWTLHGSKSTAVLKPKKQLREHQIVALNAVVRGLQQADRGKLVMACGTGKTFTTLKIAENMAGAGKRILFLVPSLSLLSQALTEWTQESGVPLHSFAVCSDSDVGKKRKKDDDAVRTFVHELRYPATTEPSRLAAEMAKRHDQTHMSVVFSTYHSIDVISTAQRDHGLAAFDLVICDEAHRTTGATFESEDESSFVKVHNADFIRAAKRIYMTATPRIYGDNAKASAEKENVALCSMDDETLYGKELHVISFSEAVKRGLLVDYKVIVLAIEEKHVSRRLQELLKDEDNHLKVDDAAKIIGCWKALSKQGLTDELTGDAIAMRRAVAFCQVIERHTSAKGHKVSSKQISGMFRTVVEAYQETEKASDQASVSLTCEAAHVDGSMNAGQKESKLDWLKADLPESTCRILSNVRCLSEGVDVPALDAVLFLTPRNSPVDVVQSVGRVMRTAPGKKRGYVIMPVVIPAGMEAHEALNDNKTYAVVWQVLQALRSHDDRFDAMVNKLDLTGRDTSKMEIIAITDKVERRKIKREGKDTGKGDFNLGNKVKPRGGEVQYSLEFEIGEIEKGIYAKLVQKCGNRHHWEEWANDIAKIARTHVDRITGILENSGNSREREAFEAFACVLRDDLNDSISDGEIIEMLAQHLITKPVFDALFENYSFARHNPMSQAMQGVLDVLQEHHLNKEAGTLQAFYDSVKMRAEGIDNAAGKQKIVVELYDKFFRNAFPKMTERLGIVYTPVEVVDFIIQSVNHILQTEFGQTLGSKGVHIIDPFTGTGTFITRLLQSGLITPEQLPHKYKHEIHANEIVLLAYYIAAINIEAVYHDIMAAQTRPRPANSVIASEAKQSSISPTCLIDSDCFVAPLLAMTSCERDCEGINDGPLTLPPLQACPELGRRGEGRGGDGVEVEYTPFPGICLADTFQLYEKEDLFDKISKSNSDRRKRQKELDIRVIMGNPPYSAGQTSANDNNQNVAYPHLDSRIRATYAERSTATLKNALYDSYIRAIRWASDRIGNSGVIGFVTNAGFLDSASSDGLRKCLTEEFSSIYIFHLRGNARTAGELRRKEKDNVFGMGSRAPIAISLLVKNPNAAKHGQIFFHNIGDYLSREDKLEKVSTFVSIAAITEARGWQTIEPDQHGDWLKQRDDRFSDYIVVGDKSRTEVKMLFTNYSGGVKTNRDAWCYNASKLGVANSMTRMIGFYNSEEKRFAQAFTGFGKKVLETKVDGFVNTDPTQISWTVNLKQDIVSNRSFSFEGKCLVPSLYRPFTKQWLYFNRRFIERMLQIPQIFPDATVENMVICITGLGESAGFSCLISDTVPNFHFVAGSQCFPLYLYDEPETSTPEQADLFASPTPTKPERKRRDAITDEGLKHFLTAYPGETIGKEDLFYYVYGLLHSPDYRERYADNLSKELPRIPCVKTAADFWAFSKAGRDLAELHLNYETVALYPVKIEFGGGKGDRPVAPTDADYRVEKMKYGALTPTFSQGERGTARSKDLTTLHYNGKITLTGIPLAAYDYIVNGKPALDWVVERQCVKTDKESGIVNDANDWATETVGNPRYPLELFQRVITVSLETMKIVRSLPGLEL